MNNILCYCIFDDLEPIDGPIFLPLSDELTMDSVKKVINELISERIKDENFLDRSGFFTYEFDKPGSEIKVSRTYNNDNNLISRISDKLLVDNYYAINGYNKYYVIAFSINYTRFYISSKDCGKQLIKWRIEDNDNEIEDDGDY